MIGICRCLIWSYNLMEFIFNLCGEFRCSLENQLAKSTFLTSMLEPLGSFKVCSDAKERECEV